MKTKKFFLVTLVALFSMSVSAQDFSGQVSVRSLTNSKLTGGEFGKTPSARMSGNVSFSKEASSFSLNLMKNQDLTDYTNCANFLSICPSYSLKLSDRWAVSGFFELDFFDYEKTMDCYAAFGVLSYKGKMMDAGLLICFAEFYKTNTPLHVVRMDVGKMFGKNSVRLYSWLNDYSFEKWNIGFEYNRTLYSGHGLQIETEASYYVNDVLGVKSNISALGLICKF